MEDTEKKLPFDEIPKFHCAINREFINGSLYAINMNRDLIQSIVQFQGARTQTEKDDLTKSTGMMFLHEDKVVEAFFEWLHTSGAVEWDFEPTGADHYDQSCTVRNGVRYPVIHKNMRPVNITAAGKNFATFDKLFLERLPRWKQCIKLRQRVIDPAILYVDWKNDESLPGLPLS